MVPPSTPPKRSSQAARKSILGRLSLSPSLKEQQARSLSNVEPPLHVPQKSGSRIARSSDRIPSHAVAGPSYESMSPRPPPERATLSNGQNPYDAHPYHSSGGHDSAHMSRTFRPQSDSQVPLQSRSQAVPLVKPQATPQRSRVPESPPRSPHPIYPALASPPRVHQATQSSSPPIPNSSKSSERPSALTLNTTSPGLHPRTTSNSRTVTRSSPVSPTQSPRHMHIIASSRSPQRGQSLEAQSPSPQRSDRQGRPMMSTRRSAASSSRTVTQLNSGHATTAPSSYPASSPPPRRASYQASKDQPSTARGLTEAGAYARAMTSTLSRSGSAQETTVPPSAVNTSDTQASKADRPLPRPPSLSVDVTSPVRRPIDLSLDTSVGSQQSTRAGPRPSVSVPDTQTQSSLSRISPESSNRATRNELKDQIAWSTPQQQPRRSGSTDLGVLAEGSKAQPHNSKQPIMQAGGTFNAPIAPHTRAPILQRPSGRLQLDFLLAHPAIQSSLLGAIGINTFLSLSGSSENVRRQFTGESVGLWVLGEWTVVPPEQTGNRWPNLTVWEGFLESLLHDPATYSTYPARWHNLLRHLSLSHTLVVLYLRSLPQSCYPNHSLLPFEDDGVIPTTLPFSPSSASISSMGQPRSRVGSTAGSDAGSVAPSRAPRRERVVEIIMPEPLAAKPHQEVSSSIVDPKPMRRRGSISSLASAASFSFGRRRSNSLATDVRSHVGTGNVVPIAEAAASLAPGKAALPPVSYPSAKRYGFKNAMDTPSRKRIPSDSRPGSLYSFQTSPSVASYMPRNSQLGESRLSGLAGAWPLQAPPPLGVRPRSSFGSVDSNRRSDIGSPVPGRRAMGAQRCEPAFDKPMPHIPGRAPVLRVFIPLSEKVKRWPSAEGAAAAIEELEKCGALKRMRLGDLIVNTAIRAPKTTEHVLLFVPFVKHLLVPLQYSHSVTGHLPAYIDAFALPPSYYYPFLPASQIIFLNLGPYRDQGLQAMRLASDRRDMTVASGARISAKRYLYVTGVEIGLNDKVAPEWHGMVSLEAEGTSEGRAELERRFGTGHPSSAPLAAWEIVKEKSMGGTVWLRLTKERTRQ